MTENGNEQRSLLTPEFVIEHSKIVQISQAPSATDHETLKTFTDMSGKKLKYDWYQ